MGTGQQSVLISMASLVVGDLYLDGPHRAQPGVIDNSGGGSIGQVFTQVAGSDGHCILGGTGVFFGILGNPKVQALYGSGGNALAPSILVPQYGKGEFYYDTTGVAVALPAACNVGDKAYYDTTTGVIGTQPKSANSGAGTVAFASNVATVAAWPGSLPPIGVGSVITIAAGAQATVLSLGSGTGAAGTYNVDNGATIASSAGFTYTSALPSGKLYVPGFEVVRFNLTGAATGVIGNIN